MPSARHQLTLSVTLAALVAAASFASLPWAGSHSSRPSHSPFVKTWRCTAPVTVNGVTYKGDCYSVFTIR